MSGEAVGSVGILPVAIIGLPIVAGGAVIYGCAYVVKALVEHERAIREEQKKRIEHEVGKYLNEAHRQLDLDLREIEIRKSKRAEEQAKNHKVSESKVRRKKEESIKQSAHDKLSLSALDAVKENIAIELERYEAQISGIKKALQKSLQQEADRLRSDLIGVSASEMETLRSEVKAYGDRITNIKKHGYDPLEKERIIKRLLEEIENDIKDIPKCYLELIKNEIMEIKQSIEEIKTKISGNYVFYENILKNIKFRLLEDSREAKNKWEANVKLLEETEKEIEELTFELERVITTPLMKDKSKALGFKAALNNLYKLDPVTDIKVIRMNIDNIRPSINALYMEYLEAQKLESEREYIIDSVQDVLSELGYKASTISTQAADKRDDYRFIELKIPGGEAVRLGVNQNKEFCAEVFHPAGAGALNTDAFRSQETRYCEHIKELKKGLEKKGLDYNIKAELKISEEKIMWLKEKIQEKADELEERHPVKDLEMQREDN